MKIRRAIKTNLLTQGFGVNQTKKELIPLYNNLGYAAHNGFDWSVKCKNNSIKHGGQCELVYCDLDQKAVITAIQTSDEFGFGVVARTEDKDGIFEHVWWHMDAIAPNLSVGSVIDSGDYLGIAGNTGRSTGAHLHRELRMLGKDTYGNYYKKNPNNGYKGCVDIEPYFENIFILDYIEGLKQQVGILTKLIELFKKIWKQ